VICYRCASDVEMLDVAGETLFVHQQTLAVTKLNETGLWVWSALAESVTLQRLVTRMCIAFQLKPEAARRDLESFLTEISATGLIRIEETPTRFAEDAPVR
jgi:hypothetical protein